MPNKWICVQNGAREHYAIPRALHQAKHLEMLFTEMWAGPLLRRLVAGPFRSLASRHHSDLDEAQVIHRTCAVLIKELVSTIGNRGSSSPYERFMLDGEWFSLQVQRFLEKKRLDLQGKIVFSYDTTALELFRWARQRGALCVLGQIDPGRTEAALVHQERTSWPGWSLVDDDVPEAYYLRREREWTLADYIMVNSRWSANALVKQGVPLDKLVIIPLCYEFPSGKTKEVERNQFQHSVSRFLSISPLRVLFLGQVILRKGIQYLMEAASMLQDEPIHFDIVGPVGISEMAIRSAPTNMTFHGRAARAEINHWYNQSDVFVLPTISDGFAITQIEAMAHGLPVIATPNCGEVVTDGVDGFIVPVRDSSKLAQAISRYLEESEILTTQSMAALAKSRQFSLATLTNNLLDFEHALESGLRN